MVDLGQERRAPASLVDRAAYMAVEVAVRAFRPAERPVHVDAEAWKGRLRRRGHRVQARKQPAISFANASARWLIVCFSSGSISPKVCRRPSGRNIGS